MNGIFVYLTVCSTRNRVAVALRRLRQPRYAVIGIGFILYVASMMMGRPRSGTFGMLVPDSARGLLISAVMASLLLASSWILPARGGLGFTFAEIQFLFPAPIARRALIGYKVGRVLFGAAASGAFLTVFVGPPRLGPGLLFAAKSAMVVAIVALHGAGIGIYRARRKEERAPRTPWWSVLAAACLLTPIVAAAIVFIGFASGAWLAVAPLVAIAVLGAHALWIVRSDALFEDAATEAAEKMERARAGGYVQRPVVRTRSSRFRLAPTGPAEMAILWKNWLLLGRTSRRTLMILAIAMAGGLTALAVTSGLSVAADAVADASGVAVVLVALLGPSMLRIDLRQDLAHLVVLKTWPLRGAALIRGELLAPAIALSLGAAIAIVVGSAVAPTLLLVDSPTAWARLIFAIAALLAATAVIVAQLVIHNGIVVSFPAWSEVRVTSGAGAMELNVRMQIVMYGALVVLALALVVPAAAGATAYYFAGGVLLPAAAFAACLFAESLAATEIFGRILDRTDLQDVTVAE